MLPRFTWYDLRVVGHYLGVLISFFSLALLLPLLTAVCMQEWEAASRYLLGAGLTLSLGSLMRMLRIEPGKLTQSQALAITGFAWIILAVVAAVPLWLSGLAVRFALIAVMAFAVYRMPRPIAGVFFPQRVRSE